MQKATLSPSRLTRCAGAATLVVASLGAQAQTFPNLPVTPTQRATAQQVAQRGVPLEELAPNAPDVYVVKRGDTLWGISGMYLKRPWRWPELWGMNLKSIPNPHLIFPGQTLYLEKIDGYARLSTSRSGDPDTVRVSPRTRFDSLSDTALPTLKPHLIEPFLVEPVVVDENTLLKAPRIVATKEDRVLMASGDRAYVRADAATPLRMDASTPRHWRVFRDAVALKDPETGEILGYEAQYLGKAELVRGESVEETRTAKDEVTSEYVPATVDLSATREEVRAGDRLLPAPAREYMSYTPRAPQMLVDARVVSIYGGSRMSYAGQNQVVAINRGTRDGMESGQVLELISNGARIRDKTDESRDTIKLPNEYNGLAMVFRTFERVSYALILQIETGVRVGDKLTNPR